MVDIPFFMDHQPMNSTARNLAQCCLVDVDGYVSTCLRRISREQF